MAKILVKDIEDLKSLQEGVVKTGQRPFATESELISFFKKTGHEIENPLLEEWINAEWLKIKHVCIGGSDAGVVTGVSNFTSPLKLATQKIADFELEKVPPDRQYLFDFGHAYETVARRQYARRTGSKTLVDRRMFQHDKHPFLIADLDGLAITPEGELIILEFKFTNFKKIAEWIEGVHGESGCCPIKTYIAQAQHCMNVMGNNLHELFPNENFFNDRIERVDFVVGSSSDAKDCKIITVKRNDKYIESLVNEEIHFMDCVDNGIVPENRKVLNDEEFESIIKTFKKVDIDILESLAEDFNTSRLESIVRLENEKSELNSSTRKKVKDIDEQLNSLYIPLLAKLELEGIKEGQLVKDGFVIEVFTKVSENLSKVKIRKEYPEFYKANVEKKEKLDIKVKKLKENS